MSETPNIVDAEATAKPAKAKPASRARPKVRPAPEKKAEKFPPGHEACYVAIPGRVFRGNGLGKADAGECVVGLSESIDELEMRGIAFRSESEAKAAFTMFKRKEEKRIAAAADVEAKRRAHRERIKREQQAAANLEWTGG